MTLIEVLNKYKKGDLSFEQVLEIAAYYDSLYDSSRFVCAVGTPISSSRDFQRAYKKALEPVYQSLLNISGTSVEIKVLEGKDAIKEVAKKHAIRPIWLKNDLE